jgi:broad specificity phosphatase PhoE
VHLIVVRHGETGHNRDHIIQGWHNSKLSELGLQQSKEVADKLTEKPDIIFSSDLSRCCQTAEPIAKKFPGVQLLFDWRLRERNFGNLQNQANLEIDWNSFFDVDPSDSPQGAEPEVYLEERVKSFIRDLSLYAIETAVIVTHGGVLNRLGYILDPTYEHRRYDNTEIIKLDVNPQDIRFLPAKITKPWRPLS